MSYVTRL